MRLHCLPISRRITGCFVGMVFGLRGRLRCGDHKPLVRGKTKPRTGKPCRIPSVSIPSPSIATSASGDTQSSSRLPLAVPTGPAKAGCLSDDHLYEIVSGRRFIPQWGDRALALEFDLREIRRGLQERESVYRCEVAVDTPDLSTKDAVRRHV